MAPIEKCSPFTSQNSAFNMMPRICQCRAIARDCGEFWLPISRRGHFLHDSFFENARANFHLAIQEILAKWKEMDKITEEWMANSQSLDSSFNLYRQLKSKSNQEDRQASTLVSDNKTHKAVMDVQDFMEGDIKVKVLGEKEVVVEGQGSFPSRGFCRKFTFPSTVNMAEVTSVVSSDGVLTIEAPKMEADNNTVSGKVSQDVKESHYFGNSSSNHSILNPRGDKNKEDGIVYYCRDCNKKIGSWHKASEKMSALKGEIKVPVKIITTSGTEKIIPVQQEEQVKESQTKYIPIEQEKQEESKEKSSQEHKDITVKTNVLQVENKNKNCYEVPVTSGFRILPVSFRGPFFGDSFFKSVHNDFQSAVQEVLSRWGARTSMLMEDNLSAYRKLRLQNLKEETQAVRTTEDETNHKFVLDVQDFMNGGEITIKALNDKEIVVEGHIEKEGGSKSIKRFMKRFTVPENIKLESVSSVMSSDGVLTITAPKKSSLVQVKEVSYPVTVKREDAKDVEVKKLQESHLSSLSSPSPPDDKISNKNIIPTDTNGHNVGLQIKVQRECATGHADRSNQEIQTSQNDKEHIIPLEIEEISNHARQSTSYQTEVDRICKDESHGESAHQKSPINQTVTDRVIPVSVDMSSNSTKTQSVSLQKKNFTVPINVEETSIHDKTHSFGKQIKVQKECIADAGSTFKKNAEHRVSHQRLNATGNEKISSCCNKTSNNLVCTSAVPHYLSISKKGLFLEDTCFKGYQKNFQEAVKDVLIKSRRFVNNTDCMTAYRSLRQSDLRVENQALYAQEDNESFKVAVDAKDFLNGDITVRVEGEELVIEGKAEKSEAKSSNSLTFSHRFLLPESFDISTIASAISSDGILTVQCPKRAGGVASADSVRKMTTEARLEHESHDEGAHKWEEKRVKQSTQKGDGFSSRTFCSSYHSSSEKSSNF
ncbi:uncharacterized protein [Palaemon carinicauda]|uniref:uncharacterized protein n=1 Tax=Palaemon carinicauda TaxID=392227 RepID=UPI0035B5ED19